ncbi:MAG: alpha-glucosidase/alpha-galactosidase [Ignavibacteria bacterium]|nr:alpha-glucosidase/alpha-galactosidase [Ignavibacteria bacterium]
MKTSRSKGHGAHTQRADEPRGLSGRMQRPLKIAFLGAGSSFTPKLVNDILHIPGEQGGEIVLVDIDDERLSTMHRLIRRLVRQLDKPGWKIIASRDRREVIAGTQYLVNCIEVSGIDCVQFDNDIPARYGIDQCIGDTIGPGGLFKALRTVPVWLEILEDASRFCPEALVLNYTNPMSMMCLAAGRTSNMQVVGLCHSVQGTSHLLARRAGVPYEELVWECAGINHLAWFTRLEHEHRDLYPILIRKALNDLAGSPEDPDDAKDLVRKDMMVHFGAFITESSGHLSEYLPYYRKRPDLRERYSRDGYDGGSGFYAREWPTWRAAADQERRAMLKGTVPLTWERSWEYASWIIEAREKHVPYRIHGNVMNTTGSGGQLIDNLPSDGCVEVACMIDGNGIRPVRHGNLPPHMAAVCDWNMRMFDMGTTAAIERSIDAAVHALMLDPLSSAVCSPAEIKDMTLELFRAERSYLKGYR